MFLIYVLFPSSRQSRDDCLEDDGRLSELFCSVSVEIWHNIQDPGKCRLCVPLYFWVGRHFWWFFLSYVVLLQRGDAYGVILLLVSYKYDVCFLKTWVAVQCLTYCNRWVEGCQPPYLPVLRISSSFESTASHHHVKVLLGLSCPVSPSVPYHDY